MMKRRVLVFPAGTEIGLEIYEALRNCKEVELFAAGQNILNHAQYAYETYFSLPNICEENWLDSLVSLCEKLDIDYIFPAYDDVIVALAQQASHIPAVILTSPLDTCLITRLKSLTYGVLADVVSVPRVYISPLEVDTFPVIVKPDRGQGSHGVHLVKDEQELSQAMNFLDDPIICEWLPGEEYTVDCFSDREQGLLFAKARVRRRIRSGISVNTTAVELDGINEIANAISGKLRIQGAWFFQIKRSVDDELKLLEVAPRIAGSMSVNRVVGVNFPLLTIFEHERLPISILRNDTPVELDRALRNRYRHDYRFSTMYVDLDDTIVLGSKINLDVVCLLYKAMNSGIKVKLITRHAGDLGATLNKYRIANIFDEVIHLDKAELKSSFITESDAIFIDDSFSERMDVSSKCGIPTFDLSMIELLLNSQLTVLNKLEN